MNRYPVWKYIIIVVAILLGALYTAPNYFGESPALQVTSGKSTVKMTSDMVARVTEALKKENIPNEGISYDGTGTYTSVRARFATPDIQFKAKSVLEKDLNTDANDPTYLVALNLQANTPQWMQSLHALPMYLGLDLRGGVHFLMQVDTKAALTKRVQGAQAATRSLLRDKNIRHAGIDRVGDTLEIKFRDDATRQQAKNEMSVSMGDFLFTDSGAGDDLKMVVSLKPTSTKEIIDQAVKQNIATSCTPGSWTTMRSAPCCWMTGSDTPSSLTRLDSVAMFCLTAWSMMALVDVGFRLTTVFRSSPAPLSVNWKSPIDAASSAFACWRVASSRNLISSVSPTRSMPAWRMFLSRSRLRAAACAPCTRLVSAAFVSTCIRKCTPPRKSRPRYIGSARRFCIHCGVFDCRFSATR